MNEHAPIGHNAPPPEETLFPADMDAARDLVQAIREEAEAHEPDLTNGETRKKTIAAAAAITRRKTSIDDTGKAMTEEWRRKTGEVNEIRKFVRDSLSEIAADVRRPVTEWEEAEKAREAEMDRAIAAIANFDPAGKSSEAIAARMMEIEAISPDEDTYGERWAEAQVIRDRTIESLKTARDAALKAEEDARELAALRAEREERERREAQERAAREAEERAERKEADRLRREAQEAQERADRAEREAEEAKAAAEAERQRREREDRERAEAEERERQRLEEQRRAQEAEAEERRQRTEAASGEAIAKMVEEAKVSAKAGTAILAAIQRGAIPHVSFEVQL